MVHAEPLAHVPGFLGTGLDALGVTMTPDGGTLRLWSEHADEVELVVFDESDLDWIVERVPLAPVGGGVWSASTPALGEGARYAVRVAGPRGPGNAFDHQTLLIEPYTRGLIEGGHGSLRSVVIDTGFDWGGVTKPGTPMDRTVVYEAHVKGLTKRHPGIPPALHGTYAGLAHPAMIEYLRDLGVTAVELLPVHAFVSEPRLAPLGLVNYWGYNTLNYFTPHAAYATPAARREGAGAVLREFKGMVRLLHEAGLEVILDVVYNHTAEGGLGGPRSSLRGIDNRSYYRQQDDGAYIDVTGCGNSVDTATDAAARLVLDSLRYWSTEVQIDGFRFDLAATLGRGSDHDFGADHPLLHAIAHDPELAGSKIIAEPWDVGLGGWQTGNFPSGWHEWNDRYRDRVRSFWLSDARHRSAPGAAVSGIGGLAHRMAGSSHTFAPERGPLAGVNFVTSHDGFTLHDLVSYDGKHNAANGEDGRDGTDGNLSFNHGVEGPTSDAVVGRARRRSMRNLLGTLLLSAGVPMLTAGDEIGRTQGGNNNAFCQDGPVSWMPWDLEPWQEDLRDHVRTLIRLRRDNAALRPSRFAVRGTAVPGASELVWFDRDGAVMTEDGWSDPSCRTLQCLATSVPEHGESNRVLIVVHGSETPLQVRLPRHEHVGHYRLLWSSLPERPVDHGVDHRPEQPVVVDGPALILFGTVESSPGRHPVAPR